MIVGNFGRTTTTISVFSGRLSKHRRRVVVSSEDAEKVVSLYGSWCRDVIRRMISDTDKPITHKFMTEPYEHHTDMHWYWLASIAEAQAACDAKNGKE